MPNTIKYNTSAETLALKRGNYWVGTNDVGKGLTSATGYWHGITPPRGGYTIYLNKATNGPAIYVAANDTEFISLTNKIAGTNYTLVTECLSWNEINNWWNYVDQLLIEEQIPDFHSVWKIVDNDIIFGYEI